MYLLDTLQTHNFKNLKLIGKNQILDAMHRSLAIYCSNVLRFSSITNYVYSIYYMTFMNFSLSLLLLFFFFCNHMCICFLREDIVKEKYVEQQPLNKQTNKQKTKKKM